jgi:flagellar biosynthesis chaperone FliJ
MKKIALLLSELARDKYKKITLENSMIKQKLESLHYKEKKIDDMKEEYHKKMIKRQTEKNYIIGDDRIYRKFFNDISNMSLLLAIEKNKLVIQLNQLSAKLKTFYIEQKKYDKLIEMENEKQSKEAEVNEQLTNDELNIVQNYINHR